MKVDGARSGETSKADNKLSEKTRVRATTFEKLVVPDPKVNAPAPEPLPLPPAPIKSEEVRGPSTARVVDHLGDEIVVRISAEPNEVNLKFDSKTLGGLEVRIQREAGKVSVQLLSASPDVVRFCERNADALAGRLADRGYAGAMVRVDRPSASDRSGRGEQGREGGSRGGRGGR